MNDRTPLCETGAKALILREAIAQTIKPLGDHFGRRPGEAFRAGVDLDTGKDALSRKNLYQGHAFVPFWWIVSSCMMTPLMNSAAPGEVNSISR